MPKITNEALSELFNSNGSKYPIYTESNNFYEELKVHADGTFPKKLIEKRRPSESEEILAYRKEIYEPITKLPISKVVNCFGKIRRSPDWMINFPSIKETKGKIPEEETLAKYVNENMPGFVSITNWAFDILLPQNLIDANAVVAVLPVKNIVNNEFAMPVPILFNSDQVFYFSETQKIAILKSRVKNYSNANDTSLNEGEKFYYIDENEIIIYQRDKGEFKQIFSEVNTFKKLPVFKIKAESYKQFDNITLNRSRIHAMVPFLNKAASGDSDLEGSKIQHLYPLFWYFQNKECNNCKGQGKEPTDNGPVECKHCSGSGKVKFSPFAHIQVDPAKIGAQSNPIPPAGYVERDTAILELQEKTIEKNNYKALAAINMQFLDQTPLSISGDAKQVDREELNNTVYATAEDIVYSIDKVIYFINEWRYNYIIPDETIRKQMLPQIPVPQNYDLLPEDYLMKEVTDARNGKVNPLLVATLEQQLAAKKFYNQPTLADNIKLYFDLDPLPGYSVDEKLSLLQNNAITKTDFIISSYAASFIKRAVREYEDFSQKSYAEQFNILSKYAAEKEKQSAAGADIINAARETVLAEMNA